MADKRIIMGKSRLEYIIKSQSGVDIGVFRYKNSKKEKAFNYFCIQLIKWWMEETGKPIEQNDLGTLKVMKLLFFACAANPEMLNTFNNWHALPYGHSEEDIRNILYYKKGKLDLVTITTRGIALNPPNK